RLHYSAGSYHASPSSWTAYTLCSQLRFGNVADLLWLACVGVTDAYIHGRLDVSGYSALCVDLKRHLSYGGNQADAAGGGMGQPMTQIGLSENGRILSQSEYKFMLLRHTSLWDSLLHSNFVASKFQVWRGEGKQKLMELLAKMGFPLDSCRQPWAFVGVGLRRRLRERIDGCTEEYGLGNVSYTGFVRVTGYKSLLSASDMAYAVTALLECSAAAMEGVSAKEDDGDDFLSEEDREDREIVQAFNVAGGGGAAVASAVVTPDASKKDGDKKKQYHVFAKPLVLTKLAQFLMDMHRENGKWTGNKARPLVLLAEKPRSGTYMVVGYEYPEEAGNVVRNKFGQNFALAAKTMKGTFWFDSFDSNVVEVAGKDVQRFIEQLHYMMESV
ncbi:cdc45-like protein, partial [Thalassiosira pseudonana CCMP1335]